MRRVFRQGEVEVASGLDPYLSDLREGYILQTRQDETGEAGREESGKGKARELACS